jgi:hypothetical protein
LHRLWGQSDEEGAGDAVAFAYWNQALDALLSCEQDELNSKMIE